MIAELTDIIAKYVPPFEVGYKFYFDETNNFRKFLLSPSKEERVIIA